MHNVELAEDIHLGAELEARPNYFEKAYECIFEIGVKLAHVLWRKVQPADRERADKNLSSICYDLLVGERFRLACVLLDFATDLKKYSSEQRKRMFIVNKAQAYKWSGDFEKGKKIITNEDWSATSDLFKLAEAVILDDFDSADGLVKKIGPSCDDIRKHSYREWPLFREYRKSEGFLKVFEEVFEEPFKLIDIDEARFKASSKDFLKFLVKIYSEKVPHFVDIENKSLKNSLEGIFETLMSSNDAVQIVDTEKSQPENQADDGLQEP